MMLLTSTGNALAGLLNEIISVLQYFGSVLQYFSSVLRYFIHQHANLALQIPHIFQILHIYKGEYSNQTWESGFEK